MFRSQARDRPPGADAGARHAGSLWPTRYGGHVCSPQERHRIQQYTVRRPLPFPSKRCSVRNDLGCGLDTSRCVPVRWIPRFTSRSLRHLEMQSRFSCVPKLIEFRFHVFRCFSLDEVKRFFAHKQLFRFSFFSRHLVCASFVFENQRVFDLACKNY